MNHLRRLPATAALALLAAAPVAAQDLEGLEIFGVSTGFLLLVMLGMIAIHVSCLHLGAAAAGLPGGVFRAAGVLVVAVFVAMPFGFVQRVAAKDLGEGGMAVLSSAIVLAAETAAIKWLYRAPWSRAALAYLVAGALTAAGVSVLILVAF